MVEPDPSKLPKQTFSDGICNRRLGRRFAMALRVPQRRWFCRCCQPLPSGTLCTFVTFETAAGGTVEQGQKDKTRLRSDFTLFSNIVESQDDGRPGLTCPCPGRWHWPTDTPTRSYTGMLETLSHISYFGPYNHCSYASLDNT